MKLPDNDMSDAMILYVVLIAGLLVFPAQAQPRTDPDWPCPQRKVVTLGAGALWTGSDLAAGEDWGSDREAAQFARKLASRRTDLNEVDGLIEGFIESLPDKTEKDKKLTRVFAGVFEIINGERTEVVNGITRYAQGQRRLAERIRDEADKVGETTSQPSNDTSKPVSEVENAFAWDRRIFEERNQSVSYVCEVPTHLEQRLGEIARKIQAKL